MLIDKITDDLKSEYGRRLSDRFTESAKLRRGKEQEWLQSLRQYKGVYDPEDLARLDANASKVYPKITRSKVKKLLARLRQILFPRIEQNWNISPTPDPSIPDQIEELIFQALVQASQQASQQTGEGPKMPTPDELISAILKYANATCDKMKQTISDQLTEMKYEDKVALRVLLSGIMYGTGIAKGILVSKRKVRKYTISKSGKYVAKSESVNFPHISFVPIWSWYPDMTAQELSECDGFFERHVMSKSEVINLASRSDFDSPAIETYLRDHPDGDVEYAEWERDLISLDADHTGLTMTRTDGTIISHGGARVPRGRRYQVLEFWGSLDSREIEEMGGNVLSDDLGSQEVNVWIIGGTPIKLAANDIPGESRSYSVFYFEKDESSIFGVGLPRIMRDSQSALCSSARMVLDNGAIVSGPQMEVNVELLEPGVDYTSMHPRKIWAREGQGVEAQYQALRSVNIDSHIPELISIFSLFKQISEDETGLPDMMAGDQINSNETVGAMSMRLGTLNISILDIARNYDTFTESIVTGMYHWNMDLSPDTSIKGDYEVDATGSASMVMKEVRMQALTQLKSVLDDEDWTWIKRREWLAEIIKAHDIPASLIRSEDERTAYIEQITDKLLKELQYKQIDAETKYRNAAALHMLTKAKKAEAETDEIESPDEMESLMAMEDQRRQNERHAADILQIGAKSEEALAKADAARSQLSSSQDLNRAKAAESRAKAITLVRTPIQSPQSRPQSQPQSNSQPRQKGAPGGRRTKKA